MAAESQNHSQPNNATLPTNLGAHLSLVGIKAANISADFPAAWPWPKTVSISCAKSFTRLLPAQGLG